MTVTTRPIVALLLTAFLIVSLALPVGAAWRPRARRRMQGWMNDARPGVNLVLRPRLNQFAQIHARHMASGGRLYHSHRALCRCYWGENVGRVSRYPGALWDLHRTFMRSAPHRRNILEPRFRRAGIGVVRGPHRFWVVVRFAGS